MADESLETAPNVQTEIENETGGTLSKLLSPTPPPPDRKISFDKLEILSEQFDNYLRIAEALLKTLKRPKDIDICTNLVRNAKKLNDSEQLDVKQSNNIFFRYYLKVLKWTSNNQPLELYQYWYYRTNTGEKVSESRTWLEENKSYMALKQLKDGSTIIYSGIADDPSTGWQDGGLNLLAKRPTVSENNV